MTGRAPPQPALARSADGRVWVIGGLGADGSPLSSTERAPCASCPFELLTADGGIGGSLAACDVPGGALVLAAGAAAGVDGAALSAPTVHEDSVWFMGAGRTETGRSVGAGGGRWASLTRVLELAPGEPGRVIAEREGIAALPRRAIDARLRPRRRALLGVAATAASELA